MAGSRGLAGSRRGLAGAELAERKRPASAAAPGCATSQETPRTNNGQRSGQLQKRSGRRQKRTSEREAGGHQEQKRRRLEAKREDIRRGREATRRQTAVFSAAARCGNLDGGRADAANDVDNPFKRFQHRARLRPRQEKETLRVWPQRPVQIAEQPCLLCDGVAFRVREELMAHIDEMHGGLQSYRNAFLRMESLCPHVVAGSEAFGLRYVFS